MITRRSGPGERTYCIDNVSTSRYLFSVRFEWDPLKNEMNQRKHGVSFEEAREVFDDPLHIALLDERFTYYEERWVSIGRTRKRKIVVAAHLYFDGEGDEVIRIVSAREATRNERRQYENES
jgi:uncharacterized protein